MDEPDGEELAIEVTISNAELFDLPEVDPDEFEEIFDWFLS